MVFWITVIVGCIIVLVQATKDTLKRERENYTKDGYPKIPAKVISYRNTPQGMDVYLSSDNQFLNLKGNGIDRDIPHERIVDVTVEEVSQDTDSMKFSYGRAVAGMLVLGTIGAVAGLTGKSKGHKLKVVIISYRLNNYDIEYMSLVQTSKEGSVVEWGNYLEKFAYELQQIINKEYKPKITDVERYAKVVKK